MTIELGDLGLYRRNQRVARVGGFPKRFKSGSSARRRPRLAKGGGGRLRRVLTMGACSLFQSKGPWREYIEQLRRRQMSDMCIIGVLMRKMLLVARAVVNNGGHYEPEKILRQT